jgi:hypothetical protein
MLLVFLICQAFSTGLYHSVFLHLIIQCHDTHLILSLYNISGLILREIKEFWRVALLLSILFYRETGTPAGTLDEQDELRRRKEKYIRAERSITDLGKLTNDGCGICGWFFPPYLQAPRFTLFIHTLGQLFWFYWFSAPDLDGVWKLKPILDGKSIMGVMQVKSGGPLIGKWVRC